MPYPCTHLNAETYEARAERARSFAAYLDERFRQMRRVYERNVDAREALPLDVLRERHANALAVLASARRTVAEIREQRPTALRTARLEWREAEIEIAEIRLKIASLQLERAEALGIARAA